MRDQTGVPSPRRARRGCGAGSRAPRCSPSDSSSSSSARLSRTSAGRGTASSGHPRSAMAPRKDGWPALAGRGRSRGRGCGRAEPRLRLCRSPQPCAPHPPAGAGDDPQGRCPGCSTLERARARARAQARAGRGRLLPRRRRPARPRLPGQPYVERACAAGRAGEARACARVAVPVGAPARPATAEARSHWPHWERGQRHSRQALRLGPGLRTGPRPGASLSVASSVFASWVRTPLTPSSESRASGRRAARTLRRRGAPGLHSRGPRPQALLPARMGRTAGPPGRL